MLLLPYIERPVYVNPSPGDLETCLIYCMCLLKSSGLLDVFTGVPVDNCVTWPEVDGVAGTWLIKGPASICSLDDSEGSPEDV